MKISPIYESEPLGFKSKNPFYNLAIKIKTFLSPEALFIELKKIEFSLGREKTEVLTDRTMDIDILFYEDRIIETSLLKIPHERATERAFVILPLLHLEAELVEPLSGKSIREIALERETLFKGQKLEKLSLNIEI